MSVASCRTTANSTAIVYTLYESRNDHTILEGCKSSIINGLSRLDVLFIVTSLPKMEM